MRQLKDQRLLIAHDDHFISVIGRCKTVSNQSVGVRMLPRVQRLQPPPPETGKKQVRFVEDLETFTYSFPCHVCDFETARKTELENHLLRRHQITMSFTHASAKRRRLLTMVETNVNTLPKVCWCSIILSIKSLVL